jgi:hypothetical protein
VAAPHYPGRVLRSAVALLLCLCAAAAATARDAAAGTRAVGSPPMSDHAAARLVKRSAWEPRPDNRRANHTMLSRAQLRAFRRHSTMPYKGRVTGHFTGTTDEIIQWAAHKHGIDVNVMRAVAVVESYWRMRFVGDDGDSFGLYQIRRPYHCCPRYARSSTAFNADYYGAIIRSYYDGKQGWLNDVEHGREYRPGDLWGSIGAWFAGRWHTPAAEGYIRHVKRVLAKRTWRTARFAAAG